MRYSGHKIECLIAKIVQKSCIFKCDLTQLMSVLQSFNTNTQSTWTYVLYETSASISKIRTGDKLNDRVAKVRIRVFEVVVKLK